MSESELDARLMQAANDGDLDELRAAIAAGADVRADQNDYVLCNASISGHAHVVHFLLQAGADVHADEDAAFRQAVESGFLEITQCLIDAGADVHVKKYEALLSAVENRQWPMLVLLLRAGSMVPPDINREKLLMACDSGALIEFPVAFLARKGFYPEELYVLLARQGHGDLVALMKSTQMLEPLTPKARAELLEELLVRHRPTPESIPDPRK